MSDGKDVAPNAPATPPRRGRGSGGVTGKGFKPGQSGNPRGTSLPADVREALVADTLDRYARIKRLSLDAEAAGDLKTAAHIELALLKKTVPDATELVLKVPDGLTVRTVKIDTRRLTKEQLEALRAATCLVED